MADVIDLGSSVVEQAAGEGWYLWNGDSVAIMRAMPDESVHYTIYSPPFISLYTFSDDPRDMSNCKTDAEFWEHYRYLIAECFRVTKPGRLVTIHCMNLPTSKLRDGFIGLRDFRGDIIRAHQAAGFIYHSEVVIRKDPVSAMQRTKAIGLLHKQICKDSSLSRMAVPDYMITMRKPGDNPERIGGQFDAYYGSEAGPTDPLEGKAYDEETGKSVAATFHPGEVRYSIAVWQRYAEPVWMDIAHSPLQLTPIRRCVDLWSNPGDVVFSPFAGIGSELYVALQMGRRAIGAELKPSYYRQAVANCTTAAAGAGQRVDAAAGAGAALQKISVRRLFTC
jgi:hypothetical protein